MRLLFSEFIENIEFEKEGIFVLNIENINFFNNIVHQIYEQTNDSSLENFKIFVNNKDETSNTKFILEPFSLTLDTKDIKKIIDNKILNKLIEQSSEIETALKPIYDFIAQEIIEIPINIDLDPIFNFKTLGKIYSYFINDKEGSVLDRIIDYINVTIELELFNTFIFVNIKQYLSEKDCILFYDYIEINELNVLLLESGINKVKMKSESLIIIDKDLCLIY